MEKKAKKIEKVLNDKRSELRQLAIDKAIQNPIIWMSYAYNCRPTSCSEDVQGVGIKGMYHPKNVREINEFEEEATRIFDKCGIESEIDLDPNYKNTEFPIIPDVVPLFDPRIQAAKITVCKGQVALVYFWASWSSVSSESIGKIQALVKKHGEWKEKVRVIAISFDDSAEEATKFVKTKLAESDLIEHYWVDDTWNGPTAKYFNILSVPFAVLVDKNTKVQLPLGNLAIDEIERNLELLLKDAILEEIYISKLKLKVKTYTYTYEKAKEDLQKFFEAHSKDLKNWEMALQFSKSTNGVQPLEDSESSLIVCYEINKKNKQTVDKLKIEIAEFFEGKINIKFQEREIQLHSIKYGEECNLCKKKLGQCEQYLCVICKPNLYFCSECIDGRKNPKKVNDLMHPHGMFYIQEQSKDVMDELVLGDLREGKGIIKCREHESCTCDVCGEIPRGIRWKCAICLKSDICEKCFENCKDPASKGYEESVNKLLENGHNPKTHVYIRQDFVGLVELPY